MPRKTTCVLLLIALVALPSAKAAERQPVVIIHGAWGGVHHWKTVADSLTHDHGRSVRRVSLTGLGERSHLASRDVDLTTHIQDVVNVIEFDDLTSVVLIAHSYGGTVAQGVVDAVPERIAQVIYIDSHLLDDGECFFTHHDKKREKYTRRAGEDGDGWLIPVDWDNKVRDTPHPLATMSQAISLTNEAAALVPASYWLLADGRPTENDDRFLYYQRAVLRGMKTKAFPWKHNPQRDRPDDLVQEIIAAIDQPAN